MKVSVVKKKIGVVVIFMSCTLSGMSTFAGAGYEQRDDVKAFIEEMVTEHGFDRADLEGTFKRAKKLDKVLESIARPAEKRLTWKQYRPIFVTKKRSKRGFAFMEKHQSTLARAEKEFGVPAEIITAIIGVETYYGRQTGGYTILDSLTTLGFDYPPRSKFFKSELKQFLLLSKEEDISVDDMTGSYAGAMGMPQFISSSYRNYAIDFDGDGKRDLWNSVPDVIGSVANYFKQHGWKTGESVTHPVTVTKGSDAWQKNSLKPNVKIGELKSKGVSFDYQSGSDESGYSDDVMATLLKYEGKRGDEYWIGLHNFYVITRYNHNEMYAMAVFQLSEKLKK